MAGYKFVKLACGHTIPQGVAVRKAGKDYYHCDSCEEWMHEIKPKKPKPVKAVEYVQLTFDRLGVWDDTGNGDSSCPF